jgi:N-methylhydantoinase A
MLTDAGVPRDAITICRAVDMRYQGQGYEIEVPVGDGPSDTLVADLPRRFASLYREIFSLSHIDEPLEVVNWKVEAIGPRPALGGDMHLVARDGNRTARGTRRAYFPEAGGFVDCPVYDRYTLAPGQEIVGPALIEEDESTCAIGVGDRARLDTHGNLVTELAVGAV